MNFTLTVSSFSGEPVAINLETGTSTFFVGGNGSGKTRLATEAETQFGQRAHRISAHRALNLNPSVAKISENAARSGLRSGHPGGSAKNFAGYRVGNRWGSKAETALLNDFDFLVQVIFAEQSNVALKTHYAAHAKELGEVQSTQSQKLIAIWDRILPHLGLRISGDDINAVPSGQTSFSAAEMSDGERAVFYIIGQVLVSEPESLLIFDEPELHIHRAILSRLWDEVEAARPDCAFLVITHDLEFAASRPGSKFSIGGFRSPNQWHLEKVPKDTGFSEELATLILGSRKPILFVEGEGTSTDLAIYRGCFPEWTIVPRGSCENVVHAVATMRQNAALTRITCAGIIDADDQSVDEVAGLSRLGVATLPVSEIENLFLLPSIARAILEEEQYDAQEIENKLGDLARKVFEEASRSDKINEVVLRYCRRRIDRTLKKIDLRIATTPEELATAYHERTSSLDVADIATQIRAKIDHSIATENIAALLAHFDNKNFFSLAALHLKAMKKTGFESWLSRTMRAPTSHKLKAALAEILPPIAAV